MTIGKIIFGTVLLYEILDFLPNATPLVFRSVSKEWYYKIKGYRLPNFSLSFLDGHKVRMKMNDYNPCNITIGGMDPIPQNIIQSVRQVDIKYFDSTWKDPDKSVQFRSLPEFLNVDDLSLLDVNDISIANMFYLTLKKLTIGCITGPDTSLELDGSKFERLEYLDIRCVDILDCNKVNLPPNLVILYSAKMTYFSDNPNYFPVTMKRIKLRSVNLANNAITSRSLPENIEDLECRNLESIPPGIKYLEVCENMPPVLDGHEKLRSLISYGITHYSAFNFRHITRLEINNRCSFNVIDLPPTLTELRMNTSRYIPLQTTDLPYSLLRLRLSMNTNYVPRFFKLPPRLRVLYLSYSDGISNNCGRIKLFRDDFPESLTDLTIKCHDVTVRKGNLPRNLRSLDISYWNGGKVIFKPRSIPQSITSLNIPGCAQSFGRNMLPDDLTFLRTCSYSIPMYVPKSLEHVHCRWGKINIKNQMELDEYDDGRKYNHDSDRINFSHFYIANCSNRISWIKSPHNRIKDSVYN